MALSTHQGLCGLASMPSLRLRQALVTLQLPRVVLSLHVERSVLVHKSVSVHSLSLRICSLKSEQIVKVSIRAYARLLNYLTNMRKILVGAITPLMLYLEVQLMQHHLWHLPLGTAPAFTGTSLPMAKCIQGTNSQPLISLCLSEREYVSLTHQRTIYRCPCQRPWPIRWPS